MVTLPIPNQRLLLAGGFALAVAAAPVLFTVSTDDRGGRYLACPPGEMLDAASGACRPMTDQTAPTLNPINPENVPFQPNEVTSSRQGDIGSLPEVDGIPCTGAVGGGGGTGECIGLAESQPTHQQPHSSVNGQEVGQVGQ